jgi:trans-aconitate 2-methyltransferase
MHALRSSRMLTLVRRRIDSDLGTRYATRSLLHSQTSAKDWSAAQYLKFEKERSRPARDLLAQVNLRNPSRIVDLGCGPGNSTAILRSQYPAAKLTGMDSSPDMLARARSTLPDVEFHEADLATYTPSREFNLLFSNAVFQWLPAEARISVMQRLLGSQSSGSVLALQVPDNFDEPSHAIMRQVGEEGPWADILRPLKPARELMPTPQALYGAIKPLCKEVDLWHSSYYHVLDGPEGVVEWVKGTGLRPFIDPLPEKIKEEFLEVYLRAITEAYPASTDGKVLLKYPRLFMVATRA